MYESGEYNSMSIFTQANNITYIVARSHYPYLAKKITSILFSNSFRENRGMSLMGSQDQKTLCFVLLLQSCWFVWKYIPVDWYPISFRSMKYGGYCNFDNWCSAVDIDIFIFWKHMWKGGIWSPKSTNSSSYSPNTVILDAQMAQNLLSWEYL